MHLCFIGFLMVAGLAAGDERFRAPEPVRQAQPLTAEDYEPAAKLAQEAMERLKDDGFSGFLDEAFSGRSGSLKPSDRGPCEKQLGKVYHLMVSRHGNSLGEIELVRSATLGRSLVRFTYLMKLERGPILWTLDFYRGDEDAWRWLAFNIADGVDGEFRPAKPTSEVHRALTAAQKGVEAIKAGGVPQLLDVVTDSERTVISMDRDLFETKFSGVHHQAVAALGKPMEQFELVRTEVLGKSLVRFVYLERFEFGAIVWKFSFYEVSGRWLWFGMGLNEWGYEFAGK